MTTFTKVTSNPTLTYWDQSGNYYTVLGGTITINSGSTSSLGTTSTITVGGNGNVVSTNKVNGSVEITVNEGTYVTAQYRGATEGAIGWWREAAKYIYSITYKKIIEEDTSSSSTYPKYTKIHLVITGISATLNGVSVSNYPPPTVTFYCVFHVRSGLETSENGYSSTKVIKYIVHTAIVGSTTNSFYSYKYEAGSSSTQRGAGTELFEIGYTTE